MALKKKTARRPEPRQESVVLRSSAPAGVAARSVLTPTRIDPPAGPMIRATVAEVVSTVGDIDVDQIEQMPGETFEDIENGSLAPIVEWQNPGEYRAGVLTDVKVFTGLVGKNDDGTEKESTLYILETATDGPIGIWAGAVLLGIMAKISAKYGTIIGRRIGIQYLGDNTKSRPGQKPAKLFRVGVGPVAPALPSAPF